MRKGLVVSVGLIVVLITLCILLPVSAQGTPTPTHTTIVPYIIIYSDGSWQYAATATQEIVPTETITPTSTPDTTCYITPKAGNVYVRTSPVVGTTIVGLMQMGYETVPLAISNGWYKVWWPGDTNYPKPAYGWTSGTLYSTRGDCSHLPLS